MGIAIAFMEMNVEAIGWTNCLKKPPKRNTQKRYYFPMLTISYFKETSGAPCVETDIHIWHHRGAWGSSAAVIDSVEVQYLGLQPARCHDARDQLSAGWQRSARNAL